MLYNLRRDEEYKVISMVLRGYTIEEVATFHDLPLDAVRHLSKKHKRTVAAKLQDLYLPDYVGENELFVLSLERCKYCGGVCFLSIRRSQNELWDICGEVIEDAYWFDGIISHRAKDVLLSLCFSHSNDSDSGLAPSEQVTTTVELFMPGVTHQENTDKFGGL